MEPLLDRSALTLLQGIRRWARMAGWPGVLAAGLSLNTLVGFSLLYRTLPVPDAGVLAILVSVSDILSLIALLGLGTTVTRLYATAGPGLFDWPADLAGTVPYSIPIILLGSLGMLLLYELPLWTGLAVALVTALSTLLTATYAMLNARGHYAWSAFLIRFPNAALIVPGVALLGKVIDLEVIGVIGFYLGATAASLALGVWLLRRNLRRGSRRISRQERLSGLPFMVTGATDLIPEQGLIAISGRILPLGQVAAFASVAILLRPFRLLRSILGTILAPDLIRFRRDSYARLLWGVWIFAGACGLTAAIVGPPVASVFYGERFRSAIGWIPYLALAGALLIGSVPARSDLGARAPLRVVRWFAIVHLAAVLLVLLVCAAGIHLWGPIVLALSVVLLQITQTSVAYSSWLAFRRSEELPQERPARHGPFEPFG